jgi:hypothetical protein
VDRASRSRVPGGVGGEERLYDGGKKVKGRNKRHLLVDTEEGFRALKAKVHSAKVMDYGGIKALLLGSAKGLFPRLSHLYGWTEATERRRQGRRRLGGEDVRVERGE